MVLFTVVCVVAPLNAAKGGEGGRKREREERSRSKGIPLVFGVCDDLLVFIPSRRLNMSLGSAGVRQTRLMQEVTDLSRLHEAIFFVCFFAIHGAFFAVERAALTLANPIAPPLPWIDGSACMCPMRCAFREVLASRGRVRDIGSA